MIHLLVYPLPISHQCPHDCSIVQVFPFVSSRLSRKEVTYAKIDKLKIENLKMYDCKHRTSFDFCWNFSLSTKYCVICLRLTSSWLARPESVGARTSSANNWPLTGTNPAEERTINYEQHCHTNPTDLSTYSGVPRGVFWGSNTSGSSKLTRILTPAPHKNIPSNGNPQKNFLSTPLTYYSWRWWWSTVVERLI